MSTQSILNYEKNMLTNHTFVNRQILSDMVKTLHTDSNQQGILWILFTSLDLTCFWENLGVSVLGSISPIMCNENLRGLKVFTAWILRSRIFFLGDLVWTYIKCIPRFAYFCNFLEFVLIAISIQNLIHWR